MKFTKMHGTSNDYVYVNGFEETVTNASLLARAVSNRRTGIGSDGLIIIRPSDAAVARMEMYNVDGSRGTMCGNGIRCVAKYLYDHGITTETTIPIDTDDGIKTADCVIDNGVAHTVRIDMGEPRFAPPQIPVKLEGREVVNHPIDINGRPFDMTCVSMGNPHAVFFLNSMDDITLDVDGPFVETHALFPNRVNVHFCVVESRDRVNVLHWERGSGATMACGTGACAVCVAGAKTGRTDKRVICDVPGGELELEWTDSNRVFMTGPAVQVFEGDWPVD